jgi:hypothetical protein
MSQEKVAIVADNNTKEFKKSAIFQAARNYIIEQIKKRVQDMALQAELIAKWADALAEQRAKANQEAWDKLFESMQADIEQRLKAQPIEGLLPEQLKTADPIVARVSQHLQQFHALKEEFAAQRAATVNGVAQIKNTLIAMNAALAPVLASLPSAPAATPLAAPAAMPLVPAAPMPTPEERDDYVKKVQILVGFGIELESHHVKMNRHIEKVEDQAIVIDKELRSIPESYSDKPALRSAAQEVHSYLEVVRTERDSVIGAKALHEATYNSFALILRSAYGMQMAPYSTSLSRNQFIFLNAPQPAFGFGRKEEEEENKLFVGYAPTIKAY